MSNPNLHTEKSELNATEKEYENSIRPKEIDEFSGQPQLMIENSDFFIKAAKMRGMRRSTIFCFMDLQVWGNHVVAHSGK